MRLVPDCAQPGHRLFTDGPYAERVLGRKRDSQTSDLTVIRGWLRGLNDDSFLALPPATSRGGPYDAADVHTTATEVLAERGLPADTAYIGWHSQTEAWDRRGRLVDLQMVYFGGDRALVRERLLTVPGPFEIGGGATDEEAFHIGRRFDASSIDRRDPDQVEAALEPLHHGHWRDGELQFRLDRQLSSSAIQWLHELVLDPAVGIGHRSTAFELLAASGAVTDEELASVHTEVAAAYAAADEGHPPWYAAATALIPLLVQSGRLEEASRLAADAVAAGPTGWEAELFALAAPSPETQRVAEEFGLTLAQARIAAALAGSSPRAEVVAQAERLREVGATSEALKSVVSTLPQVPAEPAEVGTVAPLAQTARRCAEVLTDPSVPAWLLADVRRTLAPGLVDLQDDGEWAAYSRSPYRHDPLEDRVALAAAMASSQQRLDDELGEEARAWQPPETDSKYSLWKTLDEVRDLTDSQEEWFRATLLDPPAGAAAELDAYLLEPLIACGRFTRDDADALMPVWRKRFARKHDTYQPVQPALLSFVLGLQAVEHPKTEQVRTAVLKLKAAWARGTQHVLRAFAEEDPRADLRELVCTTHLQEQHGALMGLMLSEARLQGGTPLEALVRAHEQLPLKTRDLGLELASEHPRLLNDHVDDTPGRRERAARIAADTSLPEGFRAHFAAR